MTTQLTADQTQQMIDLHKSTVALCSNMIDSLIARRDSGKITRQEYNEKLSVWNARDLEAREKLSQLLK